MKFLDFSALIYPSSAPDNAPGVYCRVPLDPSCLKDRLDEAIRLPVSEVQSACWKSLYLSEVNHVDSANVTVTVTFGGSNNVFEMEILKDGTDLDEVIFGILMDFMSDLRVWLYSKALDSKEFRSLIVAEIVPQDTM